MFLFKKKSQETKNSRSNSALELVRFILLFFLLFTHWQRVANFNDAKVDQYGNYVDTFYQWWDTRAIHYLSAVSVVTFCVITGYFVYNMKRSLVIKNLSRLLFVYVIYWICILPLSNKTLSLHYNWKTIYTAGGLWYLFCILPVYLVGPFLGRWMNKVNKWYLLPIFIGLWAIIRYVDTHGTISLFVISLFGYWIFRFTKEKKTNISQYIFIAMALMGAFSKILLPAIWHDWFHSDPDRWNILRHDFYTWPSGISNMLFAVGIVGVLCNLKWVNSKLNWLVKHCYFVYEYHFFWQLLYLSIFKEWSYAHQHVWLYLSTLLVFVTAISFSMFVSIFQFKVWIPILDKNLYKLMDKKIKPFVINKLYKPLKNRNKV